MKTSRIFLTICVVMGIVSITPPGGDFFYGILRPLSAVFFILAFASAVLEAAQADHLKYAGPEPAKQSERKTSSLEPHHGHLVATH